MVRGFRSLYSPGPLHFQGNLVVPANLDFHQCQENPEQKTNVLLQSKLDMFELFYYELWCTHSLPFFSFHPPWGVNRDSWAWWTWASFRPSGSLPPRQTITTLHHTHPYMDTILECKINIILNDRYIVCMYIRYMKVSVNVWLTGSPLRPSAPSLPLSPCGVIQKMAP